MKPSPTDAPIRDLPAEPARVRPCHRSRTQSWCPVGGRSAGVDAPSAPAPRAPSVA